MNEACDACDDNRAFILMGDFPVDDKDHDNLYLCGKHYLEFIDTAPVEILRLLLQLPIKKLLEG